MKLINLATDGIVGNLNYDFTRKLAGGCSVFGETDKNALVTSLAVALFGAAGDEEAITIPAKSEVRFAVGSKEYIVARLFEEGGTSAVLTNGAGDDILAEGEDVNAAVEYLLQLNKKAFKRMFFINKEQLAWALGANGDIRESFITSELGELTTPEEVASRKVMLRTEEAEILERLDKIDPVTRKEIKQGSERTAEDAIDVEVIRKDITSKTMDLAKAKACEEATKAYYEQAAALDAMGSHKADIDKKAELLDKSKIAAGLKSFYEDHINLKKEEAAKIGDETLIREALVALEKRLSDARGAEDRLQRETAYYANRMNEYNKAIRALLRDIKDSPRDYKVHPGVLGYYKELDEKIRLLVLQRNVAREERAKLVEEVIELKQKKTNLRARAEYKKAVEDGAILEEKIKVLSERINASNALLKSYDARITALSDDEQRLVSMINKLTEEQNALDTAICGKFKTHEDAVNSDVIIKQTLYAKHLVVSANEVELHAVLKKIEDVTKSAEHYDSKLQAAIKRKGELEAHLATFKVRAEALEEKLSDYISFNKFKALEDDIQYGDRCPICNGIVTVKKDIPLKDTRAIKEQLDSVNAEIQKLNDAIDAINENIGQFTSAKTVSEQYVAALKETAAGKKKIIDDILKEYGVDSVPALFALLKNIIKQSNILTANIDKFHSNEVEITRLTENLNAVKAEKAKLVDELVPDEKKVLAAFVADYRDNTEKYNAIKDAFNGESATDLLAKKQLIDKEYELTEDELALKEAALYQITDKCTALDTAIADGKARAITVTIDNKECDYTDVIIKVIGDDFTSVLDEADAAEESKDVAVTRLAALRRIIADIEKDRNAHETALAAQGASIESSAIVTDLMFANYEDTLTALGVSDMAGLEALILDEATENAYKKDIEEYDETVVRMTERLAKLKEDIERDQGHFDSQDAYRAEISELHDKEKDASAKLVFDQNNYDNMVARFAAIANANQDLTTVQSRIAGMEECNIAIADGAISPKDFAALVLARASGIISNISKDKYRLDMKEDGKVVLYSNARGRIIYEDRFTREEKGLYEMGLTAAYVKTVASFLGTEPFGTISLEDDDFNKTSLALISDVAKEYDLAILPASDAKLAKIADKF